MIRFQMQMRKTASLAVVVAALSACGNTSTTAPADTASGMQAAVEQAEGDAQAAGAASTGDAPLKPGQTIQGSIEADVGNGTQSFRSLATKVADDIGAQVEGKLDTGKGQRAIDDANRKLEKLGVESRVGADDVREMVEGMAGKTFHDASVMQVDIIKSLQVSLKGTASDGAQVDLAMTFDDKSLALTSSNFSYRPKANAMFDFYQSKGDKQRRWHLCTHRHLRGEGPAGLEDGEEAAVGQPAVGERPLRLRVPTAQADAEVRQVMDRAPRRRYRRGSAKVMRRRASPPHGARHARRWSWR